jgi:hypothetical protein
MAAGDFAAQRLAFLDGVERRVLDGLVGDAKAVETGEQVLRCRGLGFLFGWGGGGRFSPAAACQSSAA